MLSKQPRNLKRIMCQKDTVFHLTNILNQLEESSTAALKAAEESEIVKNTKSPKPSLPFEEKVGFYSLLESLIPCLVQRQAS
jgi:hypothetical protein